MILLPAIDLYEKKVVRLERGDYKRMTVYSEQPLETAQQIAQAGAAWLHVVDLEGAENGETPNAGVVWDICQKTNLKVEIGGGIRSMETIARYIEAGVERVILGTKAVTDPEFLKGAITAYGDKIAVGVDILEGKIAVRGWKEVVDTPLEAFLGMLCDLQVRTLICTDISKDGMLGGTNLELYRDLAARFPIQLIASGGVSSYEDVSALRDMNLYGAILGKAMYTGAVELPKALALL